MQRLLHFIAGALSDKLDDGSVGPPSFSRCAAGTALLASIGWVSYIVYETKHIPDLAGIIGLIGVLYAVNKTPGIFRRK